MKNSAFTIIRANPLLARHAAVLESYRNIQGTSSTCVLYSVEWSVIDCEFVYANEAARIITSGNFTPEHCILRGKWETMQRNS